MADFSFELKLWQKDVICVAGLDEVGRGCFAGPVVAGACAFALNSELQFPIINDEGKEIVIDDSKKLLPPQRELASQWIKDNAQTWGIGEVGVPVINRVGMAKATHIAFRRALIDANKRLNDKIGYLLIDAFYIPYVRGFPAAGKNKNGKRIQRINTRQLALVKGDEKSLSIAAASIIAKVYRDKVMHRIGNKPEYRKYLWGKNKGYGSREHQEAILKYGITEYHRKQFVDTFLLNHPQ